MSAFEMSDMPLADPRVAAIVAQFLKTCGGAVDVALVDSRPLVGDADWDKLRRGFAQVLGSEIHDLWAVLVSRHPQYRDGWDGGEIVSR